MSCRPTSIKPSPVLVLRHLHKFAQIYKILTIRRFFTFLIRLSIFWLRAISGDVLHHQRVNLWVNQSWCFLLRLDIKEDCPFVNRWAISVFDSIIIVSIVSIVFNTFTMSIKKRNEKKIWWVFGRKCDGYLVWFDDEIKAGGGDLVSHKNAIV